MSLRRVEPARRRLGPFEVSEIGLGCMQLSHGYGPPPTPAAAGRLLNRALDLGCDLLDTAALYGFGANETLLGEVVSARRSEFVLSSKCGLFRNERGERAVDGRPETIRRTCEQALRRLRTEVIDLYYLHRMDPQVPIEESVGAMAELVAAGKVRSLGLSEMSAGTLRRAHAVHPIAAMQTEYSLWSRDAEIRVLEACRELDVAFVAFSPLARGFLCGYPADPGQLAEGDLRRGMPRFAPDNYARNRALYLEFAAIARGLGCSEAQLALAWLLGRARHIIAIPGTTSVAHLEDNLQAVGLRIDAETNARLDGLINQHTVHGTRYSAAAQADVDTEQFDR